MAEQGLPKTFDPVPMPADLPRTQLFEPALKHFTRAFRLGDPTFSDAESGRRWLTARRRVMEHILCVVGDSPWCDHLVLRGSLLLKAWLGDGAREPGDVDWVTSPESVKLTDFWSTQLFADLVTRVTKRPAAGSFEILTDSVAVDDIWTYERAPGRRIVFPWRVGGLPGGVVQMDIVFGEPQFSPPVPTRLATLDGDAVSIWGASQEQSLAWKIMWLETDMHPQGKDLYDATLLAEKTVLPYDVLEKTYSASGQQFHHKRHPGWPLDLDVDWENFKLEYPWIGGDAETWKTRLAAVLCRLLRKRIGPVVRLKSAAWRG